MIRVLLPLLALTSCTTKPIPAVAERPVIADPSSVPDDGIVYETGPCLGSCPVYTVDVTTFLPVRFEGKRFTAVTGERTVALSREGRIDAYNRIEELLHPYRPDGAMDYLPGQPNCPNAPTDMPSVTVQWISNARQRFDRLTFYYGCAAANPELAAALRKVPDLLPISDLIGKR